MGVLDAPPGLRSRGAWAATTAYAKNDIVTYNGGVYRALAAFTSSGAFNPANWEQWAPQSGTYAPIAEAVAMLRTQEKYESVFAGIRVPQGKIAVGLRFDDGPDDDWNTLWPLLQARGLTAGFAILKRIGVAGTLNSTQCRTLQAAGCEMLNHSYSHGSCPVDDAELYHEVVDCQTVLVGVNLWINSFVQPGSWNSGSNPPYYWNTAAKMDGTYSERLLRSYFASTGGYIPDEENGNAQPLPHPRRFGSTQHYFPTATDTAASVTAMYRGVKGGIVLGGHMAGIVAGTSFPLAELTTLLDNIAADVAAGRIVLLNPTSMVFAQYGDEINQVIDPDFTVSTNSQFYGWNKVNSPTIQQGGGPSGDENCLVTSITNQAYQDFSASALRYGRVELYAKLSAAAAVKARVKLQHLDGVTTTSTWSGTGTETGYGDQITDYTISDTAWTKITFTFGSAPGKSTSTVSPKTRITLAGDTGGANVLWSQPKVVKF